MERVDKSDIKSRFIKSKGLILFIILLMIMIAVSSIITYKSYIVDLIYQPRVIYEVAGNCNPEQVYGNDIEQDVEMVSNKMDAITLFFSNVDSNSESEIHVSFSNDKDELIYEWNIKEKDIENDAVNFYMDSLETKPGDVYTIKISCLDPTQLAIVTHSLPNTNFLPLSAMIIDGVINENESLAFQFVEGNNKSIKYMYFLITGIILFGIGMLLVFVLFKFKLHYIFAFLSLIIGFVYLLIIPTYTVPDEWTHFLTAYSKSSMILQVDAFDDEGNVLLYDDATDYFLRNQKPRCHDYSRYFEGVFGREKDSLPGPISTRQPLGLSNFGYTPQVIGVTMGRFFNLNCEQISFLGRFMALLLYCVIMSFSIKIVPKVAKSFMFVIGLFPITMQQICSFNYDSVLFTFSFLLFACLLNLVLNKDKKKVSKLDYFIIIISTIIISTIKIIYVPILGLGLFIPKEKFNHKYEKLLIIIGLIFLTLFVYVFSVKLNANIKHDFVKIPENNIYYSLSYVLNNPWKEIQLLIATIQNNFSFYFESMITGPLGWLDISVPGSFLAGYSLLLMLSLIDHDGEMIIDRKLKIMSLALFFLVFIVILLALQITWTVAGSKTVIGVQGRYFLPVLPLLLLALKSKKIQFTVNSNTLNLLLYGVLIMQTCVIFNVLIRVISTM